MSACRIIHPASGVVSECQEERSFYQNREKAFERLCKKPEFERWLRVESARRMGQLAKVEDDVNEAMYAKNIKAEIQIDGKWTEIPVESITG